MDFLGSRSWAFGGCVSLGRVGGGVGSAKCEWLGEMVGGARELLGGLVRGAVYWGGGVGVRTTSQKRGRPTTDFVDGVVRLFDGGDFEFGPRIDGAGASFHAGCAGLVWPLGRNAVFQVRS